MQCSRMARFLPAIKCGRQLTFSLEQIGTFGAATPNQTFETGLFCDIDCGYTFYYLSEIKRMY